MKESIGINTYPVCSGRGLTIDELADFNTQKCDVIEGSLLLYSKGAVTENTSITPLSSIVEITGNLFVWNLTENVDNLGQILPNLAVIRANPSFRHLGVNASLTVFSNEFLKSISLTSLTHILGDNVRSAFWENKELQYVDTVDWTAISRGNGITKPYTHDKSEKGVCPNCDHCWNENTCQQASQNCWAVNSEGNCTCHEECLSSCNGTTDRDCLSCRHYHYRGRCVFSCPNGTARLAEWRCVEVCPGFGSEFAQSNNIHPMDEFDGECVFDCPQNYTGDNGTCLSCDHTNIKCSKYCDGNEIQSLEDAKSFEGCTHINGNLEIISVVTEGDEDEEKLKKYLGHIEHVSGYVVILHCPTLRGLQFLDNLRSIRGNQLRQLGVLNYGLAIVGNRNLRSIRWNKQRNLFLYGQIDVRIGVYSNYLLCEKKGLTDLDKLFPYGVDSADNGLLAVCDINNLSLTFVENKTNFITALHWDGVPYNDSANSASRSLIGYKLLWYRDTELGNPSQQRSLDNYNDNDQLICNSKWWTVVDDIGNKTSYTLEGKMRHPWEPTKFQVRAEFAMRNIGFRSNELNVPGYIRVPSCPRMVKHDVGMYNVSVKWSPPQYSRWNVTRYRIVIVQTNKTMPTADPFDAEKDDSIEHSDDGKLCLIHAAVDQSYFMCIDDIENAANVTLLARNVCDSSRCRYHIANLDNFVKYKIKIQAVSLEGCGLVREMMFRTTADYHSDKVTNFTVTNSSGPSNSTVNVCVSWRRPGHPNGGFVKYFFVNITFKQLSQKENKATAMDKKVHVLPRMEELGCQTKEHSYYCKMLSNMTMVEFTLLRVPQRQLTYNFSIQVASAVFTSELHKDVPASYFTLNVEKAPAVSEVNKTDDSEQEPRVPSKVNGTDIRLIVSPIVVSCFLLVSGVFMWYIYRLKRHKRKLRQQLATTSHLYFSLTQDEGVLMSNSYTPDDWEIKREDVVLENELGNGAFGLVYRGTWQMDPNKKTLDVAVKTLNDNSSNQDRLSFLHEASVMKNFESDHVVRLLGIVSVGNPVMVVMELMAIGDLKGYLRSLRPGDGDTFSLEEFPLLEDELLQFAVQIASGMAYLVDKKFIHRDLAARNCMVDHNIVIKIGDFGLTRDVYETDYYRKRGSGPLPIRWMAPESLQDGVFSHASDIWSFGIVLWEIATLAMQPYPGMSNSDVFDFVIGGGVMDLAQIKNAPITYTTLMEHCWLFKALDRPTFETILSWLPTLPIGDGINI
ncbi:insulin-like peptide receptor isoform X2 [Corticium candelabrum]|uniref:insulin-like peptide receptor isoform X2 n=1 Tax=Corticium candelabrum TaxID=121492 RepID=UPI002E26D658|nr:insulin-like peptide receptor isoform X2 [Corticium candelabrum]